MVECGCTGVRHCLVCKPSLGLSRSPNDVTTYWFCPACHGIFHYALSWSISAIGTAPETAEFWCNLHVECGRVESFDVRGVLLVLDFISEREEFELWQRLNQDPWKHSQSGRQKQDFGPKANFKKKKVKLGAFSGLPAYSRFLVERMSGTVTALGDFKPVELCNLLYDPARGSSIDPHRDDCWLWGNELVTVNLLSCTILTLTKEGAPGLQLYVPLPPRSLLVLSGEARYDWCHGVQRSHVFQTRVAMTFRNLSSEFAPGGNLSRIGQEILTVASSYEGKVVE